MKLLRHSILFGFFLATILCAHAQAPQHFNYQAIARDASGAIIASQPISVRFTIHDGGTAGTLQYQEIQTTSTNLYGLFSLQIGAGTVVTGSMGAVTWSGGNKYLQVEIDPTGGSTYTDMGAQQLVSVPYALYAASAGNSYTAGTGINITGTTITNTAPDQTVTIAAGAGTSITGTYPNFTITNTAVTPAGSIIAFGGNTAPAGWLLCDGTSYSTSAYPALFAAIGTNFGGLGGNFNVPDFRGRFLCGADLSANNDPDHALRTAMNTGGNVGNNVGSLQVDTFKSHTHTTNAITFPVGGGINGGSGGGFGGASISPAGGNETRPKNAYVNYMIKY